VPADDPTVTFDKCAWQICEYEMSHTSPPDDEALRGERQRLLVALRFHGREALNYGVQHRFPDFNELEKRILAVLKACKNLQNRSLEWTPSRPECYSFSGSPPYDFEAARLKAANAWRSQTCADLVGKVQEVMQALAHVWLAIEPFSGPTLLASLDKAETGKGGEQPLDKEELQNCDARAGTGNNEDDDDSADTPEVTESATVEDHQDASNDDTASQHNQYLAKYAIGTHDGKEWHLYRVIDRHLRQWKRLVLRRGIQSDLVNLFLKGGGSVEVSVAQRTLWKNRYAEGQRRQLRALLKSEITAIRNVIRDAAGLEYAKVIGHCKGQPATYLMEVQIGYASLLDTQRAGDDPAWKITQAPEA